VIEGRSGVNRARCGVEQGCAGTLRAALVRVLVVMGIYGPRHFPIELDGATTSIHGARSCTGCAIGDAVR
jgi:hypothetical protein